MSDDKTDAETDTGTDAGTGTGTGRAVGDVHPTKRDVLFQDRRAGGAGDHADPIGPAQDAVARSRRRFAVQFQADQHPLRGLLAPAQGLASQEVLALGLERHGETDARLEGIGLVRELGAREDQPGLDPQHVESLQAQRRDAVGLPACQIASQTATASLGWHQTS